MKLPYCTIDGEKYQLETDEHGTIRFPDDGREVDDLNQFVRDYYDGKRKFEEIFEYYTNSGNSFWFVEGYFGHYGVNNHTTTQGNGSTKHFVLYYEDGRVEDCGNPERDKEKLLNFLMETKAKEEAVKFLLDRIDSESFLNILNEIEHVICERCGQYIFLRDVDKEGGSQCDCGYSTILKNKYYEI
jgi:ribosomal protein L37E